MKYPSPRAILTHLSTRGPSAVQAEAIDLLLTDLPERWPNFERGSREALLRRLAANRKKSAKIRLEAVKELLRLLNVEATPKATEIDEEIQRLISGADPPSSQPDADTRGPNSVPEPKAPPVPSRPASEVPDVQNTVQKEADVQNGGEPRPIWREDPVEANKLAAELAAKRHRETFSIWDWFVLGHRLAEEREKKKPKPPRLMIGGPGGELCD